jgi:hypothetical protein
MSLFSKAELAAVDALASGKKLTEEQKENLVPVLKEKLGASSLAEIPQRFIALTGWANRPKDYPA